MKIDKYKVVNCFIAIFYETSVPSCALNDSVYELIRLFVYADAAFNALSGLSRS